MNWLDRTVDLLSEMNEPRVLQTKKGSKIKRSKYGVGKDIGGAIYLHKDYISSLPKEFQKVINKNEPKSTEWNVIKYEYKKEIPTYFSCVEFDTEDEPVAGDFIKVVNGEQKVGKVKQIWHHKWLWVKDDYKGFDVQKSFDRSKQWLQLDDIPFNRIGNKDVWEKEVVSRL